MLTHGLPVQNTALIGRERELAEISARLADSHCRLLTLTGPGGVGKTRLALEVAYSLRATFPDSSYFVPLQPLTSSDFVVSAIADAIGFRFHPGDNLKQQLINHLREKALLLLLDNFEHVLDAADLLPEILNHAAKVRCLVTSRERLRLREEWVFDVHGLSYPAHNTPQPLSDYSAVQLFRYSAVRAGYTLADADIPSIIHICQLVEGMPLALELAASWARVMRCAEIASEIERGLDILTTTARNMPGKHRSMSVVFEHSWKLLSNDEEAVFRKLSVFRGGFTREAAEQVAGGTLAILASLVDKSLLRVGEDGRYSLQELLRQFTAGKLLDVDETAATVQCHLDYFTDLAERTEAALRRANQRQWMNILETELDNFRAALSSGETGLRLAVALCSFWNRRGYLGEGRKWLIDGLTRQKAARTKVDRALRAWALHWLATFSVFQGDLISPQEPYEESLALFRELEDIDGITEVLDNFAVLFQYRGDMERASDLHEEGMALRREHGDAIDIAYGLYFLGVLAYNQNHIEQAHALWMECLAGMRAENDTWSIADVLAYLAMVEVDQGDFHQAEAYVRESLTLLWELGERWQIIQTLEVFACMAAAHGRESSYSRQSLLRAAQIFGAAAALRNTFHTPLLLDQQQFYDRGIATLRSKLDHTTFADAWAAGQGMTLEQAVSYALYSDESEGTPPADQSPNPLTERELEILRLLADGLSTREAAQRLFLSNGTVRWYLNQIYSKLSVHSRIQAITRARELKLLG